MTRKPHRAINQQGVPLLYHIETQLEGMRKAVDVAKEEIDRRLAGMNEFREQLKSQADTFVIKELYDREHMVLLDKIEMIREVQLSKADGSCMSDVSKKINDHVSEHIGREASLTRLVLFVSLGSGAFGALLAWLLTHK